MKNESLREVNAFLDSSAYAKRFMEEIGSEEVDSVCGATSTLVLSVLCVPEIIAALNRRLRDKILNKREYSMAKSRLAEEIKDAWIANLTPDVLATAVFLLEKNILRAADAIHIACALESDADSFVSADKNQIEAARKSGLKVHYIR